MSEAGGAVPAAAPAERPDEPRRARWLWLLVALQIAIPASYYLRENRDDERFAWRMFSAVRAKRCRVQAARLWRGRSPQRVDVGRVLHSGWVRSLERGRSQVIERLLEQLCQGSDAERVRLERRCDEPSGRPLAPEYHELLCARPVPAARGAE